MNALRRWWRELIAPGHADLDHRITALEHTQELIMTQSADAYARLDAEIEALRNYVNSDDATDAAEIDRRTEQLKELLASVRPIEPDPETNTEGNGRDVDNDNPTPTA